MKKHYSKMIGHGVMALTVLAMPLVSLAQGDPFARSASDLSKVGTGAGIATANDLPTIVGKVINVLLGFMGIVLLGYFLFAGFKWMTAGGEEEGVKEAKTMIRNAIIGLVIIIASYAISNFVIQNLTTIVH